MQEEVYDLQNQADYRERHFETQLSKIQSIFGYEFDVDALLNAKIGSKEFRIVKEQNEGVQKLENLLQRSKQLEYKLEQNKQIFEEIRRVEISNQEKRNRQINQFKKAVEKLQEAIEKEQQTVSKEKQEELKPNADRWQKILTHSHMQIEERGAYIFNIPNSIQNNSEYNKQIGEVYEQGKSRKENQYRKQLSDITTDFKQKINDKVENYSVLKENKLKSSKNFRKEFRQYYNQKIYKITQIRKEMLSLFNYITVQNKIINDVHNGVYNQGIRPALIPQRDIPSLPGRMNFPSLYKTIEKLSKPTLGFQIKKQKFTQSNLQRPASIQTIKSRSIQKMTSQQAQQFQYTQQFEGTSTKSLTQLLEEAEQAYAQSLMYQGSNLPQISSEHQLLGEIKQSPQLDLDANMQLMNKSQAQEYIQQLKQTLKFKAQQSIKLQSQQKLKSMQEEPIQSYIQTLEEERQRYKSLYQEEVKLKNENKSVVESQRKIIERGIFITLKDSRPSTAQSTKRPGTGRPGTADLRGKQISPYVFVGKDPLMTQINPQTLKGLPPKKYFKNSMLASNTINN